MLDAMAKKLKDDIKAVRTVMCGAGRVPGWIGDALDVALKYRIPNYHVDPADQENKNKIRERSFNM